jgi:hypothetical protein
MPLESLPIKMVKRPLWGTTPLTNKFAMKELLYDSYGPVNGKDISLR